MPHSAVERRTRRSAQALRRHPTDAERKLGQVLRSLNPLGFHFRRQAPIGPYVVDFAWSAGKLIIEVDGGQHADTGAGKDRQRTAWLEAQGYRVLRLWNHEVLMNTSAVGGVILSHANRVAGAKHPTPNPSPQGGGEHADVES